MDPTATVTEIRELTTAHQNGDEIDHDRYIELVAGLDQWLTRCGRLPDQWYLY